TELSRADLHSAVGDPINDTSAYYDFETTCPNGEPPPGINNSCAGLWTGADCPTLNLGPAADLHNCDLEGITAAGLDLTGADLSGTNIGEADFTEANLTDADLTSAFGTGPSGSTFHKAIMTGTDLSKTELSRADLHSAVGDPINDTSAYYDFETTCPNGEPPPGINNSCAGLW
ncbi:MAG: pentapeptide repeat-containing protein, partial [Ketobacter sp.]|nr:pentapeptide repeat-containing protein [Ketobacter sp.]